MIGAKVTFKQKDKLYIGTVRDKVRIDTLNNTSDDKYVVEVYSLKGHYKSKLWIINPSSLVLFGWDKDTETRENQL